MKKFKNLFTHFIAAIFFLSFAVSCNSGDQNTDSDSLNSDSTQVDEIVEVNNILSDEEKADGWVLLFDGTTSNGWHSYAAEGFPQQGWAIEDGMLSVMGSGQGEAGGQGGDIITDKTYTDFEFTVEWMVTDSANSGIFFMVQEKDDARIFHSAPEMQVLDDNGHPDGSNPDNYGALSHRAGSLYDLIKAPDGIFKGANVWHKAYIKKQGDQVVFKLNDVVTAEFTLWDEAWDELVAGSKFNEWDLFGAGREGGNLGLQDHGDTVHFRNIKIKEL